MAADERRRKILEALSVRRYETCDNLAFEFGVSVRTIYNDLLHLSREYPIYTSQGHKGGIRMMDGYYVNRKSLTDKQEQRAKYRLLLLLCDGQGRHQRTYGDSQAVACQLGERRGSFADGT